MSLDEILKRLLDIILALFAAAIAAVPIAVLLLIVKLTSRGPTIYWSERVGQHNKIFLMPKIRSMSLDTPQVATDLLSSNSSQYITPIGRIIRKTSMDEMPQFWSILIGDMSFVGPRPALFNQYNLIDLRTARNVHTLKPGLTGWAQINGRDNLTDEEKANLDEYYLKHKSFFLDIKIMLLTFSHVLKFSNVAH